MGEQRAIVAVLAGGRGERLGGAKALVALGGQPLIARPLAAARAAGLETVVVAKPSTALPELRERVLREPEQPSHPLCGVLTALEFARTRAPEPASAVVLIACDMPFLTAPLLAWLAALPGSAMAEVDGRAQPLLARCLSAHLPRLRDALAAGTPLRHAIRALAPRILDERELRRFGSPERLCFNVNDPGDLRDAERWIAQEEDQAACGGD